MVISQIASPSRQIPRLGTTLLLGLLQPHGAVKDQLAVLGVVIDNKEADCDGVRNEKEKRMLNQGQGAAT
jgi:hypothetical protein